MSCGLEAFSQRKALRAARSIERRRKQARRPASALRVPAAGYKRPPRRACTRIDPAQHDVRRQGGPQLHRAARRAQLREAVRRDARRARHRGQPRRPARQGRARRREEQGRDRRGHGRPHGQRRAQLRVLLGGVPLAVAQHVHRRAPRRGHALHVRQPDLREGAHAQGPRHRDRRPAAHRHPRYARGRHQDPVRPAELLVRREPEPGADRGAAGSGWEDRGAVDRSSDCLKFGRLQCICIVSTKSPCIAT